MLSDRGHPRFKNLNSTVPVDVVRIRSLFNVNSLSTRVQVRVWVNERNLVQAQFVSTNKHSMTSISISIWSLSVPIVSFPLLVVAQKLLVFISRMAKWTKTRYVLHI